MLTPFLHHARHRLHELAGDAIDVLAKPALVALERHLLRQLTHQASLTLGHEFSLFRLIHSPAEGLAEVLGRGNGRRRSTALYRAFVTELLDGGLRRLMKRYAVLARLLVEAVCQWCAATAEFCRRAVRDLSDPADSATPASWRHRALIKGISAGLSDPHGGGRTVLECRLENGKRIMYKPRSVGTERAFNAFLCWFNQRSGLLPLRVLDVQSRDGYGWIEAVEPAPCKNRQQVAAFYERSGILLALMYALGITDIHCENLLAAGEDPVVVDVETLLDLRDRATWFTGGTAEHFSVLTTGLMPRVSEKPHEGTSDLSALGHDRSQLDRVRIPAWGAVNTDQMRFTLEALGPAPDLPHRVRLGTRYPAVSEYTEQFIGGFERAYHRLISLRSRLLRSRLLALFDGLDQRIIIRDTATYTALQLHLLQPKLLRDAIDRSIELEWLARPLGIRARRLGRADLYMAELEAIEHLDVPRFTVSSWRSMRHGPADEPLWALGAPRDGDCLRQRLAALSAPDCSVQLNLIRNAIANRFAAPSRQRSVANF